MNVTATQVERRISRDAGRTAMAKPFGRYTPEIQQPVRQLEVKGDEVQRLRRAREMLRSMSPEQVKQIIEWHKNLTVFEALILAKKQGYLIVPNDVHDRILTETEDVRYLALNYPVWTGTFVMYEAPNKPFGDKLIFTWEEHNKIQYTITFNVPKKYQGKKNCALVVEHPDFDLEYLGNNKYELKVSDENSTVLIKNFPNTEGWYLTDYKHKLFFGKGTNNPDKTARHLFRVENHNYLGLLVRGASFGYRGIGNSVDAGYVLSVRFGVAMVPLVAASKDDTF